jgi:CBS domain-containing protein
MLKRSQGDFVMRKSSISAVATGLFLLSQTVFAEDVTLPAPVLEWSFYILLIFAACVAVGISIFMRGNNAPSDSVDSLLDEHNPVIHSVRPDVSVTECVRRMNKLNIGAMLVMENDQLIGVFTERDAITRVLGAGLDPVGTLISTVMTKNPVWVSPATSMEEAMAIVTSQRIRHLPVVEDGRVLGLVSSGDLVHKLVKE